MPYGNGGTNFWDGASPISHAFCDENGDFTLVKGTVANIPSGQAGYAKSCNYLATDGGVYVNTGTSSSCTFTLLDTALSGPATSLVDSSQLTVLDTGHTATAVNNFRMTNSAAGAVTANAVLLSAVGTDSAISIQISPKGATGILTLGLATGTGDIVVGSSSGAQAVKLGNGAGASTVNLANVTVAGATVNVASAVTGAGITDTITIAGGNAAATGIKVVNILTGTPGTSGNNRLTLGGGVTTVATINATVTSYQEINYQATEGGANNAITCNLVDASGANITLAAGLRMSIKLAHSLQAGGNTLALNGGSTKAIKSHNNPANDIGTAYVSGGIVDLFYDGTQWQDMSQ